MRNLLLKLQHTQFEAMHVPAYDALGASAVRAAALTIGISNPSGPCTFHSTAPRPLQSYPPVSQKLEDLKLKTEHVKLIRQTEHVKLILQDMYVAAKPASMTVKDMSTCTATERDCCENFKEIFKREN